MSPKVFQYKEMKINKAVYTYGLIACCWSEAVTILYWWHQALAESLLIVSIAQIVLSCKFGSFLLPATDQLTDQPTNRLTDQPTNRPTEWLSCVHATKNGKGFTDHRKPFGEWFYFFHSFTLLVPLTYPRSLPHLTCCVQSREKL